MSKINLKQIKSSNLFWIGLSVFFISNAFSAATMGIHYDEAYYWLYAQHLAFGYFDHPPMVAWMIRAGLLIFQNILGLRLITIIISSLSIALLWSLVKTYANNPLLFWALIYSILIIHPYSFITTPDAPLFFFTVLYFVIFKRFLDNRTALNTALFALVTALLIYSKYHSILVIAFSIIANISLFRKKEFWIYIGLVIVLLLPHIIWQLTNNFVSFRYHLLDSHKTNYKIEVSLNYLLNQLILSGPWLGWLFLYGMGTAKVRSKFEKTLKLMGIATFVFFFISTFAGDNEPHWTLIAFVPVIILSYKYLAENTKWHKWLYLSATINFTLLLFFRLLLITPWADSIKAASLFTNWDKDAKILQKAIGSYPILFQDSWNRAARFAWYTNNPSVSGLNSGLYRRNQYDIWNTDELIRGKTVCIVTRDSSQFSKPTKVVTDKSTWYFKIIPDFTSYYDLTISLSNEQQRTNALDIEISNPYNYTIVLDSMNNSKFLLVKHENGRWNELKSWPVNQLKIPAKGKIQYQINNSDIGLQPATAEIYLMFKTGELKPIPSKILLN